MKGNAKKKKRRKDKRPAPLSAESLKRIEGILQKIEENPDPDVIQQFLAEDQEFAATVASNEELAEGLAAKANAFTERKEAEMAAAQEPEPEPEATPEPEAKIDLNRVAMDGCDDHPDEVKRMVSFKPLADATKAKKLHSAAMTLEEWTKKKAELAEAEKKRFLAQGNVMGKVKCRHCKGPHWSAACPTLKKTRKKEDAIGGGGGYKKPFWECLKCGAENSNKRKHDCYKCGALWRSGWAKSGQAW